jgi:hypothetical protein
MARCLDNAREPRELVVGARFELLEQRELDFDLRQRPAPATIEQLLGGGNARGVTVCLSHELHEAFDGFGGVKAGELADFVNDFRTPAGVG